MVLRSFALEAGIDVEVRSVFEAARGQLAVLLDPDAKPVVEEQDPEEPPVIHRRPSHWFV